MAEQTERPPSSSSARTLAEALWFPVALFLGFLLSFAPALHAPQPHHVKVVVANPTIERRIDSQLQRQHPGGFDVTAVTDGRAARQAVLNRDAAAGFVADSRHPVLYVAKANGMSLELALRNVFTEVAGRSHQQLKVDDVAPTASKDLLGSTLVYFGIAWSVPGYILATTLLRAVTFSRRRKLLTIAGVAALFSVVGNLIGAGLGYIPATPSAMAISFLLTMAVATSSSGLAPFARRFFPAVGMGLFIVLSIPTSGGVAPASMLPTFFQHVHAVMPLANAVDALRGVLYFDGAGVLKPVLVLCAWIAAGVALLGLDAWLRNRRAAGRYAEGEDEVEEPPVEDPALEMPTPTALPVHRHHFGEPIPTLVGTVHDSEQQPVRGAAVTVMDTKGRQLVRTTTNEHGAYAATGLPEGYLRIVVSSVGRNPLVHQKLLQSGAVVRADFALHSREASVSHQAH
ncbi:MULTISPECIES: carboxypeptidase regulatory-like domain-containing protein [unclassified Streptomyces]|uniref:carboxypeptidase regulatory-like domain-containing protein n=1 Tax=unclassified Streptomyces TaxID=2593676 RepID=UPI002E12883E|nr:carboxypeptidase regulatory-like domain-containing protein [Streptomyces sp. NBC_01744]WSJ48783.1 carboxypeptidase regulatory-like domain-containing protein [Streptomyces sp. NBC_01318]